jgi:addiction module HigA family antidote
MIPVGKPVMFIWTTMIIKDDSNDMIITKRQPVSVGEIIKEEYLEPLKITQEQLARAMGVSRRTVNEICNAKRYVTVDTALLLAKVFENTPDFWLNAQRRSDLWKALNTPERKAKIDRAKSIREVAA